jgi:hypothetical protein
MPLLQVYATQVNHSSWLLAAYHHELMKYIADSFGCEHPYSNSNFSDEFIRELIDDALHDLAEEEDTLITIKDGDWLWPRIIRAVRRLVREQDAVRMFSIPTLLRCVQIMTNEVQWQFPNFPFDFGELVDPQRLATLYPGFGGPSDHVNICCDRDLARWVVRSINHWLCVNFSPLERRMGNSELGGPIKRWLSDNMLVNPLDEGFDALLEVLHKLRRTLHEKGRIEVELEVDHWVNEFSDAFSWSLFNETTLPGTVNIDRDRGPNRSGTLFMPVSHNFGAFYVNIEGLRDQQLICNVVSDLCQWLSPCASTIPRTDKFIEEAVRNSMSANSRVTPLVLLDYTLERLLTAIRAVIDMHSAGHFTVDRCILLLGLAMGWSVVYN